jgi:hypothetical protein
MDNKRIAVPTEPHHFGGGKLRICLKPFTKGTLLPGVGIASKAKPIVKKDDAARLQILREKA